MRSTNKHRCSFGSDLKTVGFVQGDFYNLTKVISKFFTSDRALIIRENKL